MTGRIGKVSALLQTFGTGDVQPVLDAIDDDIVWRLPSLGVLAALTLIMTSTGSRRVGGWRSQTPALWGSPAWITTCPWPLWPELRREIAALGEQCRHPRP
jgi:hypothetical protein